MSGVEAGIINASMAKRIRPTESGTEFETLTQMLDFLRATIVAKATGVNDTQAIVNPISASELTIGGLVKHLTGTERFRFSIDFAGLDVTWPWTNDDPHGNFRLPEDDTLAGLLDNYEAEYERSRQAIAGQELDKIARSEDMNFTLRYALAHMVEETARHCGHLDLLRESIDGMQGE